MEFWTRPERSFFERGLRRLNYSLNFNTTVDITTLRRRRGLLFPRFIRSRHVHRYPLHNPSRRDGNPSHPIPINHPITNLPTPNPIPRLQLPLHTNTNTNTPNGLPLNNLLSPRLPKPRPQLPFRLQRLQLGKRNGSRMRALATEASKYHLTYRQYSMGKAENGRSPTPLSGAVEYRSNPTTARGMARTSDPDDDG